MSDTCQDNGRPKSEQSREQGAALAQLARGRMRAKITALEEAFTGHFTDHHAFLLARMLDADIAVLGAKIEQLIAPFAAVVGRLDEVDGVGRTAA